ncbi:MAG TPA: hypothetical protein VGK81_06635, partial [Anaerolineae bacterium]
MFIRFTFNPPEMWVNLLRKLNPAARGECVLYGAINVQQGISSDYKSGFKEFSSARAPVKYNSLDAGGKVTVKQLVSCA